jgi:hypothetical protein
MMNMLSDHQCASIIFLVILTHLCFSILLGFMEGVAGLLSNLLLSSSKEIKSVDKLFFYLLQSCPKLLKVNYNIVSSLHLYLIMFHKINDFFFSFCVLILKHLVKF